MTSLPSEWQRCRYFGFWDVPRTFIWRYGGKTLLLTSEFREDLDDYDPQYQVYELDQVRADELDCLSDVQIESGIGRRCSEIPVAEFRWHPERERAQGRFFARVCYMGPPRSFDEVPGKG